MRKKIEILKMISDPLIKKIGIAIEQKLNGLETAVAAKNAKEE